MKNDGHLLGRVLAFLILAAVTVTLAKGGNKGGDRPLACLAMTSADSDFTSNIAGELETRLVSYGNRVMVSYCENDVNKQMSQIENYIAMDPAILVIDCIGGEEVYEDILCAARDKGIRVVALSASGNLEAADIQMVNSSLGKGICASILIKDFLDQTGTGPEEYPVKALLLGNASTERDIMTMAGYQMITERFLRRYDMTSLSFVKEEGEQVFYTDGYGVRREVEEPTGGLLLNERGEAILNLYYEPRIALITADNYMSVQTNLQGQRAIDAFLGDRDNRDVRIVVATSSDVAVGAASRIEACLASGDLMYDAPQIAVFGVCDTALNRDLVAAAAKGEGVFRGFVGDFSISREVDNLIRNLRTGNGGVYRCYSFYSGYSMIADETGIITLYDPGISSVDVFGEGAGE